MKIAVLGPKGTFSDRAYVQYKEYYETQVAPGETLTPVYYATIDEVFEHVCPAEGNEIDEVCELGIVPIENTLDGYVLRTLDLLHEKDTWILDENMVEVQFSLVGNVNSLDDIRRLYVQFKTNGQCRRFINSLNNAQIITTESNMDSYYKIADNEGEAAIVPLHIARSDKAGTIVPFENEAINDVNKREHFIVDHVTDAEVNFTRFVVFKREQMSTLTVEHAKKRAKKAAAIAEADKDLKIRIPVYIMPKTDRPGILYEILKEFYENEVNLISIMSRPTKQEMGTYNFYIEIDGLYERIDTILNTVENIRKHNGIKILGIYGE